MTTANLVALNTLGAPILAVVYNELAAKPVTRFATKDIAIQRTELLLGQKNMVITSRAYGDAGDCVKLQLTAKGSPALFICPIAVLPSTATTATTPKQAAKKAQPAKGGKRGVAPATADAAVITVLTKENPKRKGSRAARHFACYTPGITVAAFLDACVKSDGDDAEDRGWYRQNIRWDLKHGFISVE